MSSALKPPIILFGNVRSGTTMIHDLFDTHPDVVSWFEPRTVWNYADPGRAHDRYDETDATDRVKAYVRRRFLAYQRKHGDRRVMEKTPACTLRIPYVARILPEARFLYILREPLANLASTDLRGRKALNRRRTLVRLAETPTSQLHHYAWRWIGDHVKVKLRGGRPRYYGVRYPGFEDDQHRLSRHELIATQWVRCSRQADADLEHLEDGRCLKFRYEDFVERPREWFPRILEHLELSMTPALEDKLENWVDAGRRQKWRRLEPDLLRRCLDIVRPEMERQGYEVPTDLGPAPAEPATS